MFCDFSVKTNDNMLLVEGVVSALKQRFFLLNGHHLSHKSNVNIVRISMLNITAKWKSWSYLGSFEHLSKDDMPELNSKMIPDAWYFFDYGTFSRKQISTFSPWIQSSLVFVTDECTSSSSCCWDSCKWSCHFAVCLHMLLSLSSCFFRSATTSAITYAASAAFTAFVSVAPDYSTSSCSSSHFIENAAPFTISASDILYQLFAIKTSLEAAVTLQNAKKETFEWTEVYVTLSKNNFAMHSFLDVSSAQDYLSIFQIKRVRFFTDVFWSLLPFQITVLESAHL